MKIINCTPHDINVVNGQDTITFPRSGIIVRCGVSEIVVDHINGIPVTKQMLEEIEGAPLPIKDTVYIVSRVVAEAARRDDFIIPGSAVRDSEGRIIGCKGFCRV